MFKSILLVFTMLLMVGCAASANPTVNSTGYDVAGFWLGLWHGCIAPIAFVVGLLYKNIGVYEIHNSGGWYDLGFLLGVGALFTGSESSSFSKSKKD